MLLSWFQHFDHIIIQYPQGAMSNLDELSSAADITTSQHQRHTAQLSHTPTSVCSSPQTLRLGMPHHLLPKNRDPRDPPSWSP